jgi:uncharacterized protein (DUF1697 family)
VPADRSFVALLRGVNIGKAKRVPMAELREIVEDLGGTGVATLLNSGNVVFRRQKASPARIAAELSAAIEQRLGIAVPVIVKAAAEFAAIIRENPFAGEAADPSRVLVAFTQAPKALAALSSLAPLASPPERFAVRGNAAYLSCPAGILESRVGAALLGQAGASVTTRNWATCLKLQALLDERDSR